MIGSAGFTYEMIRRADLLTSHL